MIWLLALLLGAPPTWQSEWKSAFNLAREQHRLVIVSYTQTEARCKPCWELTNVILKNSEVQDRISGYVLLHVDPDINAIPLAHRYAPPALVIFDWGERERFRIDGEHVLRADDWHETWGKRDRRNYAYIGPLGRFHQEARAFVKAAELFDEKKDDEANGVLAEAYERLHMTAHARAAAQLVKSFSRP